MGVFFVRWYLAKYEKPARTLEEQAQALHRFINEVIQENGTEDKYVGHVKSMQPMDRRAINAEGVVFYGISVMCQRPYLGLLVDGRLCNAGCLALARPVTRFLVSAKFICTLFQGREKTMILDQKVYEDDLLSNYRNAMLYLKSHLNTRYIITGERTERLELPEVALREAVLNAMAHRDYRSGSAVQIWIFEDRVEILNPGGLVGGLAIGDLGKLSAPRNPLLFGLMYRLSLVEQVGSGFRRIQAAMADYGLPAPEVIADRLWFGITFRRLDRLRGDGLLQHVGPTKSGWWEVAELPPPESGR